MLNKATLFTIGHSTHPISEFIEILKAHEVTLLADIRTIPKSRFNPQFNKETLEKSLVSAEISYVYIPELGGLRHTQKDSINKAWRNASFRGYADYMQTREFSKAIIELIKRAKTKNAQLAIMCAEAVPWRCHRSLVADALMARNVRVEHILNKFHRNLHKIIPCAEVKGTKVTYPAEDLEQELSLES